MAGDLRAAKRPQHRPFRHAQSVACGQREANTQPAGGSIGEGGSPLTVTAALRCAGSSNGVAASNIRVYGCCGAANIAPFRVVSPCGRRTSPARRARCIPARVPGGSAADRHRGSCALPNRVAITTPGGQLLGGGVSRSLLVPPSGAVAQSGGGSQCIAPSPAGGRVFWGEDHGTDLYFTTGGDPPLLPPAP